MRLVRVGAGLGVLALAGVLVWHLTHQPKSVLKAVSAGKIVQAPPFRLEPLSGAREVSLAALRGRAVVINFWASDCGPCKQEMPRLEQAAIRWSADPVSVVGIDVLDSRGAARAFVAKRHVTYAIGFDRLGDTVAPYGILGTPTTFFVDKHGRIVKRVLGPVTTAELETQIARALKT